jgi:hypothetical protein
VQSPILPDAPPPPAKLYNRPYRKAFYADYYVGYNRERKQPVYKKYHIFVVETILGRKLLSNEIVHHIDGNSLNNTSINLCVMTKQEHSKVMANLDECLRYFCHTNVIVFNRDAGDYCLAASV